MGNWTFSLELPAPTVLEPLVCRPCSAMAAAVLPQPSQYQPEAPARSQISLLLILTAMDFLTLLSAQVPVHCKFQLFLATVTAGFPLLAPSQLPVTAQAPLNWSCSMPTKTLNLI